MSGVLINVTEYVKWEEVKGILKRCMKVYHFCEQFGAKKSKFLLFT